MLENEVDVLAWVASALPVEALVPGAVSTD
jgi:hypothetical protein